MRRLLRTASAAAPHSLDWRYILNSALLPLPHPWVLIEQLWQLRPRENRQGPDQRRVPQPPLLEILLDCVERDALRGERRDVRPRSGGWLCCQPPIVSAGARCSCTA